MSAASKGKVVVIGITGRMGTRIAPELMERGYQVLGVNRRPERVSVRCDFTCETAKADAGHYDEIYPILEGADTVVMATEATREHPEKYPLDVLTVLTACKAAGVKRFIVVLNVYALTSPDNRPMLVAAPEIPPFHQVERRYPEALDLIRGETALDWLAIASPAELVPYAGKTGKYRTGAETIITTDPGSLAFKETSRLSMEDFADFIAGEVEHPQWHRQLVTAAY